MIIERRAAVARTGRRPRARRAHKPRLPRKHFHGLRACTVLVPTLTRGRDHRAIGDATVGRTALWAPLSFARAI